MKMTPNLSFKEALPFSSTSGLEVLIVLSLAVLAYVAIYFLYRRFTKQTRQNANNALTNRLLEMDQRMRRVDQSVLRLIQRIDQLQLNQGHGRDIRHAELLLHDGASVEQLIELCGMSRGEAELFQRLHGGSTGRSDQANAITSATAV
ncbi:MAG: DUF2802 domain-containing protein [Gammaproteobacteria bacterium]|nr:DUF2802 domain-containing protein [Gammaproteobacteria bacterium]